MRAREFVINVPITIQIDGDGAPVVNDPGAGRNDYESENSTKKTHSALPPRDPKDLDPNPVMVPPLQQQLEIDKAAVGKSRPVIDELIQDEEYPVESNDM